MQVAMTRIQGVWTGQPKENVPQIRATCWRIARKVARNVMVGDLFIF